MPSSVKSSDKPGFSEPMVIFPLKQYETLMEYLENIEDRLAVAERANEPELSQGEVEKLFNKKFGKE